MCVQNYRLNIVCVCVCVGGCGLGAVLSSCRTSVCVSQCVYVCVCGVEGPPDLAGFNRDVREEEGKGGRGE